MYNYYDTFSIYLIILNIIVFFSFSLHLLYIFNIFRLEFNIRLLYKIVFVEHLILRCGLVVLNIYLVQVTDTFQHNTYLFIYCINK